MGLRAGWLALMVVVWIIGAFLGSTFEYHASNSPQGVSYTTGTGTFTTGSSVVTGAGGATWSVLMVDGVIKANADSTWTKIKSVGGGTLTNGTGWAVGSRITLAVGANTVTVGGLGTFTIFLPAGNTGTATSGVACLVAGSPMALVAGNNTINTDIVGSSPGTITITVVGTNILLTLYSPYLGAGGINVAYTMATTPGWAGSGTGGYSQSPVTTLQYLMNLKNVFQGFKLFGFIPLPVPNLEYFDSAFKVLTWRWSFMQGYDMIYWIFCAPFAIMGIFSLVFIILGLIRGNINFG